MFLLKKIAESGVHYADSKSERRNIVLSNYTSMIASSAILIIFMARFIEKLELWGNLRLLAGSLVLLLPLLFNRFGMIFFSRILLCWVPPFTVMAITILGLKYSDTADQSLYTGIRFYLIAYSCFPFLVFNLRSRLLLVGLLGPTLFILLIDPILNFFGVGYRQMGFHESAYEFNNVRAFVSFAVLGASSYFLKQLVEQTDEQNEKLLGELAKKNKLIQRQADDEVNQLLDQLQVNLQHLSEREFMLAESQRIAKVGSWEFRKKPGSLFWSDEMYSIFGIDKSFDIQIPNLREIVWGKESAILDELINFLLNTGQPFDITMRTKTPIGYSKWVRVNGFPIMAGKIIEGVKGICHDVTFYKEAEERSIVNERRYHVLFDQASDAIMVTDFSGNFTEVNDRLCKLFGYRREELLQLNISKLMDAANLKDTPIRLDELIAGEHFFSELVMKHKDGTLIEVESNIKRSGDDKIMSIVRDVTAIRKVQKQVQVSEAQFRGAFEYSAIGMGLVSLEGKWMKVNRELCHMLGYLENELLSLTFQDITHPDDLQNDLEFLNKTLSNEIESYRMEKRYFHKNGSVVWINLSVSLIRDIHGNPLHFVSQVEDITKRKQEQESLVKSQANLNATINNTEVMIWSVDREYRLIMFNQPFFQYMKKSYGIELVQGLGVVEDKDFEETKNFWLHQYNRALAGEIIKIDSTKFGIDFSYSLSPIIENNKVIGVSVIADDVTERRLRDRELAEANKKIGELKLMALRSVMNPHFVFNVLNSIQYYIAKNDRLNAINYLTTFSKLMRSILTHSVNNKIKLIDEIDMLKNYVHLEMTRFENKFDFNIAVDSNVDVENIEIPSLLIQPYVENAILHGLYNKKEKGTLFIKIKEEDEAVIFEIEDDGVGREEAMKLRQQNFPSHKSMGVKLTEERLKLINNQNLVAFEIEDLKDKSGPKGTRVHIRIAV